MRTVFKGILLAALLLCLSSHASAQTPNGLAPLEPEYDFGCIGIDYQVYHNFKLVNYGSDTVRISRVYSNCDCSFVAFADTVVPPQDTASFKLTFNTKDFYGRTPKTVIVISDDKTTPEYRVSYLSTIGQWMHRVRPTPASLFYLPVHKTKTLSIDNLGRTKIHLRDIEPLDDMVTIEPQDEEAEAGESLKIEVKPQEDLPAGTFQSCFRLTFDVEGAKEPLLMTIPVKIVRY